MSQSDQTIPFNKPVTIVPPRPPKKQLRERGLMAQSNRRPSRETAQVSERTSADEFAFEEAAPPAGGQHIPFNGGTLLTSVQVYTVFWGAYWEEAAPNDLAGNLNTFFAYIVGSSLIDSLSEYNINSGPAPQAIGHGSYIGTVIVADPDPGSTASDEQVQAMITDKIAANLLPQPNGNIIYFVFLPPGTTSIMGGGNSCTAFCGYHGSIDAQTFYAVIPDLSCASCRAELSVFDALTSTCSHELCEAITDPIPGTGWYDDTLDEIGDPCAWIYDAQGNPKHNIDRIGPYVVQKLWSNRTQSCQ